MLVPILSIPLLVLLAVGVQAYPHVSRKDLTESRVYKLDIDPLSPRDDLTKPKVYNLEINPLAPRSFDRSHRDVYHSGSRRAGLNPLHLRRQSVPSVSQTDYPPVAQVGQDGQDGAVTNTENSVQISNIQGQGAAFFVGNTSSPTADNSTFGFITGVRFSITNPVLGFGQLNTTAIQQGVAEANSTGPVSYVVLILPSTFPSSTWAQLAYNLGGQFSLPQLKHLFTLDYTLKQSTSPQNSQMVSYDYVMNATDYSIVRLGHNLTESPTATSFVPTNPPADPLSRRHFFFGA